LLPFLSLVRSSALSLSLSLARSSLLVLIQLVAPQIRTDIIVSFVAQLAACSRFTLSLSHFSFKASKSTIKAPINSFQNFTTHGGLFPDIKS